jgi:hypothetical protein
MARGCERNVQRVTQNVCTVKNTFLNAPAARVKDMKNDCNSLGTRFFRAVHLCIRRNEEHRGGGEEEEVCDSLRVVKLKYVMLGWLAVA